MSFFIRHAPRRGGAFGVAAMLWLVVAPALAERVVDIDRPRAELPQPGSDKVAPRGIEGLEVVRDVPGEVLPPQLDALGCATPTTTGTLLVRHPFYDVMLGCDNGSFAARTGASHPVTALAFGFAQNVIYGGAGGDPRTSDVTWRFHDQGISYLNPTGGAACIFDPPDTVMEPNSIGVEEEWLVTPAGPTGGITCVLREEIVAFGTTATDSGVRLTLSTTNLGISTSDVNVGVRWQIDYQNAIDDGPWFATVTCDPPTVIDEWSLEHELLSGEIRDFYRIQNNQGFPTFSNVTSTTSIVGIPDTGIPDRLVFGRWPVMNDSSWGYNAVEGSCCPDDDSAVLWYHGFLPADGDIIAPGQTVRHSVVIFSSADNADCGEFTPGCETSIATPPASQRICLGDTATLDASGVGLNGCSSGVTYVWTDGVDSWSGPIVDVSPAQTTTYRVLVRCTAQPSCGDEISVTITVDAPPSFQPPVSTDPDDCNQGIMVAWNPATFNGPSGNGSYSVYRSEISCADALLRPPHVTGMTATVLWDTLTIPSRTYYYVVVAEDDQVGTACSPPGPANGGSVTRLCSLPTTDFVEDRPTTGLGAVLRASHSGDAVTMEWSRARALLPFEHVHLLKAWHVADGFFVRVNPEADVSRSFTETDRSAMLQFFDLRVANKCEGEAGPEYPPGWP